MYCISLNRNHSYFFIAFSLQLQFNGRLLLLGVCICVTEVQTHVFIVFLSSAKQVHPQRETSSFPAPKVLVSSARSNHLQRQKCSSPAHNAIVANDLNAFVCTCTCICHKALTRESSTCITAEIRLDLSLAFPWCCILFIFKLCVGFNLVRNSSSIRLLAYKYCCLS